MGDNVGDDVSAARAAFARHDWRAAFDLLRTAEEREPLGPADVELLAESARWAREYGVMLDALEQAEARYERSNEPESAARAALFLCREHFVRNRLAEAGGWLGRAARLLEGLPECAAHGYLRFAWVAWRGPATTSRPRSVAHARRARSGVGLVISTSRPSACTTRVTS